MPTPWRRLVSTCETSSACTTPVVAIAISLWAHATLCASLRWRGTSRHLPQRLCHVLSLNSLWPFGPGCGRIGEQPERFEVTSLRHFVLERAGQQGIERAKTVVTAVRMFLRFLIAIGRCQPGLEQALPTIAHWRLAYLPRYLPAESIEQVLASCNLTTAIGVRDRAVLLLLAQLGLRAGDVAALKWCDINWH